MKSLLFVLLIVFLSNCKQENTSASKFNFYPPLPDSADIKKSFIERRAINSQRFNLPTLFAGSNDSIVIRFWPWDAFEFWTHMFEFRVDSNGWKGYHYCSYTFTNQDGRLFHIYGHEKLGDSVFVVKQIIPKSGWAKFYDSLQYFKLRDLPTQSLINNFKSQDILDGDGLTFEIASKNSYRCIQYNNPDDCRYEECKLIVALKEMIIRQFGDDYFWPRIIVKKVSIVETKKPSRIIERVNLFSFPDAQLTVCVNRVFPILFYSLGSFYKYCYFIIQHFYKASLYIKIC